MKKIQLLMVALISIAPVFAQDDGEDLVITKSEGKNAFFLGPKVGGVFSSMTQPEQCNLYDKKGITFSAGLALQARFGQATENSPAGTGMFGAGIEGKFKQNKIKTIATDEEGNENANLSLSYIEVPVYVHFYPLVKSSTLNTLYIEAGPDFAFLMSRNPKTLTASNLTGEYSSVKYVLDNEDKKLKGMDVRVLIGLGYTIPNTGLDINARYYIGTSKLAKNFASKMNSFEVSLAWMFNIGKF